MAPVRFLVLAAVLAGTTGCTLTGPAAPHPAVPSAAPGPHGRAFFRDATRSSGISFVHVQGTTVDYLPQVPGPGVAMFDLDGDGHEDLFFVQGSGPDDGHDSSRMPPSHLYRAVSAGTFEEVGQRSGLVHRSYGQAVLVCDLHNDGYPDLVVTSYHEPVRVWLNNGDGTFREEAAALGLDAADLIYGSAVAAIDHDRDGFLDVLVGQYARFEQQHYVKNPQRVDIKALGPQAVTAMPGAYEPLPKRFFRNLGNRRFADVTQEMGVSDPAGRTMGAVSFDVDGDGWQDLFLANDLSRSTLFHNEKGKRFTDITAKAWLDHGSSLMGVTVGDYNLDDNLDLFVTNWIDPPVLLGNFFRPRPSPRIQFLNRSAPAGLTEYQPDRPVGWAAAFADLDNDSFQDLVQINGHTHPEAEHPERSRAQPAFVWMRTPEGGFSFEPASGDPADPVWRPRRGRGAAFGDLDRDGYVDVAVGCNNDPGELWIGRGGSNGWIGLLPAGTRSNRDGVGLRVTVTQGSRRRLDEVTSGESYYSSNASQLLFGLGADASPITVYACWPSGHREWFRELSPRKYHRLAEGAGVRATETGPP